MNLKEKVVVITGASKGIGRATAITLAKQGCSVILNYKSDIKDATAVLKECNKHSQKNILVQADVSVESDVARMFKEISEKFPQIDALINNAGIFDENDGPTHIDAFENTYRNNFLSCVLVTKYALSQMSTGKIVNVSSVHGRVGGGRPGSIAYSAFKAALENYTRNLAKNVAPNILVNAIAPGRVATPMWSNPSVEKQDELGKIHLIKRMIQPEEIAEGIVFLLQNDAMCGEVLAIDGGFGLLTSED